MGLSENEASNWSWVQLVAPFASNFRAELSLLQALTGFHVTLSISRVSCLRDYNLYPSPAERGRGWWKGVKCQWIGEDVSFGVVHVLTPGFDLALIRWCTFSCCSLCQPAPNYTEWEFPKGTLTRLYFLTCRCTPETKRAALLVRYARSLYCSFCKALALCQKQDLGLWKRNKI